jgi:membrane-bound metal-dependent hydrolase YbcI (DUF457 family)
MFLAHLPSGFLATRFLQNKIKTDKYLIFGLIGSIAPDFDLIYFNLAKNYLGESFSHRQLITHTPFFWLVLLFFSFLQWRLFWFKKHSFIPYLFFCLTAILHLILDTLVGKINWLFPLNREYYGIGVASYPYFSFIILELIIIIPAIWIYVTESKKTTNST